jgi:hypothetical protein
MLRKKIKMNVESKTQLCSASSTAVSHLYQNIRHFSWPDKMDENCSLAVFPINFTMGVRERTLGSFFFFLEHELERAEDRRLSADWIRCPLNGLPLVNDDREIRISRGRDIRSDSTAQQVTPIGIPVQPPIRSKSVLPSGPVSTTRQRSQTQATKLVGGIFMVYMPDHRKNRAFQTLDSIARTDRSSHRIMREGAGGRRRGRGAYSGWAREEHEAPRGSPPPPRGRAGDDAATWREPRRRREGHRSGCCCCGGCGTRNFHGRREEENERQGLGWCGQPAHQSIRWWWISCVLREAKTIWWLRA